MVLEVERAVHWFLRVRLELEQKGLSLLRMCLPVGSMRLLDQCLVLSCQRLAQMVLRSVRNLSLASHSLDRMDRSVERERLLFNRQAHSLNPPRLSFERQPHSFDGRVL
jgi:hypothetical protein